MATINKTSNKEKKPSVGSDYLITGSVQAVQENAPTYFKYDPNNPLFTTKKEAIAFFREAGIVDSKGKFKKIYRNS